VLKTGVNQACRQKRLTTDHASGPESIAGDVNNPSDLIDEADVDDVENDTEQSNDETRDAEGKQLDVVQ